MRILTRSKTCPEEFESALDEEISIHILASHTRTFILMEAYLWCLRIASVLSAIEGCRRMPPGVDGRKWITFAMCVSHSHKAWNKQWVLQCGQKRPRQCLPPGGRNMCSGELAGSLQVERRQMLETGRGYRTARRRRNSEMACLFLNNCCSWVWEWVITQAVRELNPNQSYYQGDTVEIDSAIPL